jgi:hypothetical protein
MSWVTAQRRLEGNLKATQGGLNKPELFEPVKIGKKIYYDINGALLKSHSVNLPGL